MNHQCIVLISYCLFVQKELAKGSETHKNSTHSQFEDAMIYNTNL